MIQDVIKMRTMSEGDLYHHLLHKYMTNNSTRSELATLITGKKIKLSDCSIKMLMKLIKEMSDTDVRTIQIRIWSTEIAWHKNSLYYCDSEDRKDALESIRDLEELINNYKA